MELHRWDVSYEEARDIQVRLREQLQYPLTRADFRWVGGADVAYDRLSNRVIAAIVVLHSQTGEIACQAHSVQEAAFPYIPGLLSFREGPAVLQAWEELELKPELLVFDGQGLAHPRRFGLACHLGLWLKVPSLGCAKSRLLGDYEEPGFRKGRWSDLKQGEEILGAVVRTRDAVKPVFVSQGYLLPLPLCIEVILRWSVRHRIPEPTRQAHLLVTRLRRQMRAGTADTMGGGRRKGSGIS